VVDATAHHAGRCAVVTGAAGSLGTAIGAALARDGWTVIGVDLRTADRPDPAADHPDPLWVQGDVRAPDTLTRALASAREHGGLGAWINNAGIPQGAIPLQPQRREEIDHMLAVNLTAVVHAVAAAGAELAADGGGAIVNVSSIHAARPSRGWAAYAAAKAGLEGLTRAAAAELGPQRVRVNAVAPGQVATARHHARLRELDDDERGAFERGLNRAMHPIGRVVTPAEVAAVVAFLAGPAASGVTGAVVPIDGGRQASDPQDALVAEFVTRARPPDR
jgi:NAD(P)-dependent dehydrogenase (short-subunit alcohol dehydrogenase family)